MAKIIARFDGGCVPNPGGNMSFGWHTTLVDGKKKTRLARDSGPVKAGKRTSNVAEYSALIELLSYLMKTDSRDVQTIEIRGDSQLVVNAMNATSAHAKCPHLQVMWKQAVGLVSQLRAKNIRVEITWNPREENQEADELAAGAMA